jgi:hypothetical protein
MYDITCEAKDEEGGDAFATFFKPLSYLFEGRFISCIRSLLKILTAETAYAILRK